VGVRYMGINEGFAYLSQSDVSEFDPEAVQLGSALWLNTRTNNTLWGPQIGGRFEIYSDHRYWVNFDIKGAICNNSARQVTNGNLIVAGVETPIYAERSENRTAYVADFALTVVCRLTPHLTTRIGYQGVWIHGLALGGRNLVAPDVETLLNGPAWLDTDGEVFYHGPVGGLELTW